MIDDSNISLDDDSIIQTTQVQSEDIKSFRPKYEIKKSIEDQFYRKFFSCLISIKGQESQRYTKMEKRLGKYFGFNQTVELGYRWRKRIEPSYDPFIDSQGNKVKVFTTSNLYILYGVDFLSNKQIMEMFNIKKDCLKRVNMSNMYIQFQNHQQAVKSISPHILNAQNSPFFKVKEEQAMENSKNAQNFQEGLLESEKGAIVEQQYEHYQNESMIQQQHKSSQNQQEQGHEKYLRCWFPLKFYQYGEQTSMPWAIRYATNKQRQQISFIRQQEDFLNIFEGAKHIYKQKTKQKQMKLKEDAIKQRVLLQRQKKFSSQFPSQINSDFNNNSNNINTNSGRINFNQINSRQRSRQKSSINFSKKSRESNSLNINNQQDLEIGQILIDLDILPQIQQQNSQIDLSVINNGLNDSWLQQKKKVKSQQEDIEQHFANLQLNDDNSMTLQQLRHQQVQESGYDQQDPDKIDFMNSFYSPMGLNDSVLWQNQTQKTRLMKLNPVTKKFKYSQYVQKTMMIQDQEKRNKKKDIIIIND